jgi:hypothetical protein
MGLAYKSNNPDGSKQTSNDEVFHQKPKSSDGPLLHRDCGSVLSQSR